MARERICPFCKDGHLMVAYDAIEIHGDIFLIECPNCEGAFDIEKLDTNEMTSESVLDW